MLIHLCQAITRNIIYSRRAVFPVLGGHGARITSQQAFLRALEKMFGKKNVFEGVTYCSTFAPTQPKPRNTTSSSNTTPIKMPAHVDFVAPNKEYAANFGDKANLPLPPAKKLTIVTCMDARLNVYAELGIKEGDAHIIRNAGGVARDALRSIIISQRLLGTREIAVFHHTGCGMATFTTPQLRKLVKDTDPHNAALAVVDDIHFLEFTNVEESVRDDVEFLKSSPLILSETIITGWVYEVETGKIKQIV